tara:strand:- start:821 stop:1057 length:237 start_codon:yes stop_codon:yes gene_type:complete
MNIYKTLYQRALDGDFEINDVYYNLERCREISKELKIMDIIDPNSKQIGLLSELLFRMKNMPELEILDITRLDDQEPN